MDEDKIVNKSSLCGFFKYPNHREKHKQIIVPHLLVDYSIINHHTVFYCTFRRLSVVASHFCCIVVAQHANKPKDLGFKSLFQLAVSTCK